MDFEKLKNLHEKMNSSKKEFFDAFKDYEQEHGKAIAGSIIKSTCSKRRNRKLKVFEVVPALSSFSDSLEIRTYYRAKLLDGKGNEIHGELIQLNGSDFEVIKR